jgi:hypothetical protein
LPFTPAIRKKGMAPMYFLIRKIIRYFKRRKQQGS